MLGLLQREQVAGWGLCSGRDRAVCEGEAKSSAVGVITSTPGFSPRSSGASCRLKVLEGLGVWPGPRAVLCAHRIPWHRAVGTTWVSAVFCSFLQGERSGWRAVARGGVRPGVSQHLSPTPECVSGTRWAWASRPLCF